MPLCQQLCLPIMEDFKKDRGREVERRVGEKRREGGEWKKRRGESSREGVRVREESNIKK